MEEGEFLPLKKAGKGAAILRQEMCPVTNDCICPPSWDLISLGTCQLWLPCPVWSSHTSYSSHLPALTLVFYAQTTSWSRNKGQQHTQIFPKILKPTGKQSPGAHERGDIPRLTLLDVDLDKQLFFIFNLYC